MPMRLQELIHKFEEGAGFRYLKFLLAICVMIAAAVAYDLAALRNLSTPEGMETAQLAWNISEGRGYSTYCIRPFDIHLLRKKFTQDHEPSNHAGTNAAATLEMQAVRLNGSHPDLANPPVYPFLLAGFFKVVQLSHPDLAIETRKGNKWLYEPDVWIAIFNQFLFIVLVGAVFFLTRRLFDEPVAWVSSLALLG